MTNSKNLKSTVLVTGAAGFIGASLSIRLLNEGLRVIGIDNINNYYSRRLKKDRISRINNDLETSGRWKFFQISLEDKMQMKNIFAKEKISFVINLAAQAGVRNSIKKPMDYVNSNIVGFLNVLELCREYEIEHLIYASSSSVYGSNSRVPFREDDEVNHPISLYAATKRSNELMAHTYSHLFKIPATGLRFFTVYGPWGRPDMAPMIFAKSIMENKPISVFNFGNSSRDFTYIDDIVEGIFRCLFKPATIDKNFNKEKPKASTSFAPHRIFNIGNNKPVNLIDFISLLENYMGKKAIKKFLPMQMGDVEKTFADINNLKEWVDFEPQTQIDNGIKKFVDWFKVYNKL